MSKKMTRHERGRAMIITLAKAAQKKIKFRDTVESLSDIATKVSLSDLAGFDYPMLRKFNLVISKSGISYDQKDKLLWPRWFVARIYALGSVEGHPDNGYISKIESVQWLKRNSVSTELERIGVTMEELEAEAMF